MLNNDIPGTPIEGTAALVTGGNRGFGRAMVEELLDRGAAKVYATARSPHTPQDQRIVPLALDVTDDNSVAEAAKAATDVSIVVNNAGIALNTPVLDAPLADIRAELETNLFGTIRVTRAFSPILARHPSSSLVNVLSVLSWLAIRQGLRDLQISRLVRNQLDARTTARPRHSRNSRSRRLHGHRHDRRTRRPESGPTRHRPANRRRDRHRAVRGPRRRNHPYRQVPAIPRPHQPLPAARPSLTLTGPPDQGPARYPGSL